MPGLEIVDFVQPVEMAPASTRLFALRLAAPLEPRENASPAPGAHRIELTVQAQDDESVVRHADIAIERDDAALVVRIEDDGVGFSPQAPRKPNSFGLLGLRERASLLGGEVMIDSAPGEGTIVEVRLPNEAPVASA